MDLTRDDSSDTPVGTKETAFIHAMMAAGLVHGVTRSCSQGNMTECGCDTRLQGGGSPAEGWHWGGCSDHIQYGIWFSRKFIDSSVRNTSASGGYTLVAMNQHNSESGRQVRQALMSPHINMAITTALTLPPCLRPTGGCQDYGDALPLPRRLRLLWREDLLEDSGASGAGGRLPEGALRAQRPGVGPVQEEDQEEGAPPPCRAAPTHLRQQVS